jgi:hypothetical protein
LIQSPSECLIPRLTLRFTNPDIREYHSIHRPNTTGSPKQRVGLDSRPQPKRYVAYQPPTWTQLPPNVSGSSGQRTGHITPEEKTPIPSISTEHSPSNFAYITPPGSPIPQSLVPGQAISPTTASSNATNPFQAQLRQSQRRSPPLGTGPLPEHWDPSVLPPYTTPPQVVVTPPTPPPNSLRSSPDDRRALPSQQGPAAAVVVVVQAAPKIVTPPDMPVEVTPSQPRPQAGTLRPPSPLRLRRKRGCRSLREAALGMGNTAGA